jgi:hypothetical protein
VTSTHKQTEPVNTTYSKAPARTVTAEGVTYAYRELGPKGGVPVSSSPTSRGARSTRVGDASGKNSRSPAD